MKLVYIAGPYRAATEHGVAENIRAAEMLAIRVWELGAACICPHKNTSFMGGVVPDQVFLDGDIEILKRCDAVLLTEDWHRSVGARGEVMAARNSGKPVFDNLDDLERWLGRSSGE